jgi:hypothetical protein
MADASLARSRGATMNWYYATGVTLTCLTIAIPIWAASRADENSETVPATLQPPEQLDD